MGIRQSVVAENISSINRGYDVVIRIEDIEDALLKDGGGGWKVEIVNEATRWVHHSCFVNVIFIHTKFLILILFHPYHNI